MKYRVIFMGSPEFAIPSLSRLKEARNIKVVAVVTQPDKPSGRGKVVASPPVKEFALAHNLPVLQPAKCNSGYVVETLRQYKPDVIIVIAFGQLLGPPILELAPAGCVNVHASLLPRWRGAAPIAAAILAGDERTGITIMKLDTGMDSGPIITQEAVIINPTDTTKFLEERLALFGSELLINSLSNYLSGLLKPISQDEDKVTYAPRIKKEQGRIDWGKSAQMIERQIRAFNPWPGSYTMWSNSPLFIWEAAVSQMSQPAGAVGSVFRLPSGKIAIVAGDGLLVPKVVQQAGRNKMTIEEFSRGARNFIGFRLGPDQQ